MFHSHIVEYNISKWEITVAVTVYGWLLHTCRAHCQPLMKQTVKTTAKLKKFKIKTDLQHSHLVSE